MAKNKRQVDLNVSFHSEGFPVLDYVKNRIGSVIENVTTKLNKIENGLHSSLQLPFKFIRNVFDKVEDVEDTIKNSGLFGQASDELASILQNLSTMDLDKLDGSVVTDLANKVRAKSAILNSYVRGGAVDFDLQDKLRTLFGNITVGADKVAKDRNLNLFVVELIKALRQLKKDTIDDSLRVIFKELADIVKADVTITGVVINALAGATLNIANLPALLIDIVKTLLIQNPMIVFPAVLEVLTSMANILKELISIARNTSVKDFETFIGNVRNAVKDDAILNVFERIARRIYVVLGPGKN